jgi:hypothetical protein
MVVLFFAVGKKKNSKGEYISNDSNKDYTDRVKKGILKDDADKCVGIDISVMKDLQVSSLDNLLKISDDVQKAQHDVESFLKSLEKRISELQNDYTLIVNLKNKPHKLKEGILSFSWDDQKYPKTQKSIENVLEKINDKLNTTKGNLKTKSDDYNMEVEKLKQKQKSDNDARVYMKKDFRVILKNKTEIMVKSQYLSTLLAFVPINQVDNFKQKYETLMKDCVVPGSGLQLCANEDEKVRLYRVVVMDHLKQDYMDELRKTFKTNSKEYDEAEVTGLSNLQREQKNIEADIEDKKVIFI